MKSPRIPQHNPLFPAWVLVLGIVVSALAMRATPFNHVQANVWGDTVDHFGLIQQAGQALKEGQFPLREVPSLFVQAGPGYQREGVYQFYANLPMTLGGLLAAAGVNPWHAFFAVVFAAFLAGWLGLFALAREWGCVPESGALAALAYTLAPYHLVALSLKGAFPELCVFGLLPWVMFTALRAARSGGWKETAFNGLAWAALMMTHHIFHAWSLVFVAAGLVLARAFQGPKFSFLKGMAGYGLGLSLSLWFVFPGLSLGGHFPGLVPEEGFGPSRVFYDLKNLLAHVWVRPFLGLSPDNTSVFHLGWPILAGVLGFAWKNRTRALRHPAFWLFAAAFLLAWGPVDYWGILGPLKMIQAKSRLLIYASLFGSILAGLALNGLKQRQGQLALALALAAHVVLHAPYQACGALPYSLEDFAKAGRSQGALLSHQPYPYFIPQGEAMGMDPGGDLELRSSSAFKRVEGEGHLALLSLSGRAPGSFISGKESRAQFHGLEAGSIAVLPAAWYPGLYRARVNGQSAPCGRVGNNLAVALPAGDAEVRYWLAGSVSANAISLTAWLLFLAYLAGRVIHARRRA